MTRPLSAAAIERVSALFDRRIRERKPAAYLTGEARLAGYAFRSDERAIIPRSYIAELLGDGLAPWIPSLTRVRSALDLCTGSGSLAILIARAFPRVRVDAVDISTAALALTRANVARHRMGGRVRVVQSDMFAALHGKRYDLIVANPPYVPGPVMRRLPPEYRWEPAIALAGGADGLDFVRRIIAASRRHLNPGGWLVVEVGRNRKRLERLYPGLPFVWPETSAGSGPAFLLARDQLPVP
jgi:ribosomal protein L3 glutamine methyltransferase